MHFFLLLKKYDLAASSEDNYKKIIRIAPSDINEDELAKWIRKNLGKINSWTYEIVIITISNGAYFRAVLKLRPLSPLVWGVAFCDFAPDGMCVLKYNLWVIVHEISFQTP